MVSNLTEELVRLGHEVTLFATADSRTRARLFPAAAQGLRRCHDPGPYYLRMMERIFADHSRFDLLHFHCGYMHFPWLRRLKAASLTTWHGRLDFPEHSALFQEYRDIPMSSISLAQRGPVPLARWVGNVHHGLPEGLYPFRSVPSDYLVFMGRVSYEKRLDRAIEIARRAGRKLKIAAKVDPADGDYFRERVRPLLKYPNVEFLGEVPESGKAELLGGASAMLFPIDWPEPFGLAVIEAMACGTPTIAFDKGSMSEIIENGVNGFRVGSIDEAVEALGRIRLIDRAGCRRSFEKRFTAARMAADYLALYQRVLESAGRPIGAAR